MTLSKHQHYRNATHANDKQFEFKYNESTIKTIYPIDTDGITKNIFGGANYWRKRCTNPTNYNFMDSHTKNPYDDAVAKTLSTLPLPNHLGMPTTSTTTCTSTVLT